MPRTPQGGERRYNEVVLTPAREATTESAKGRGRGSPKLREAPVTLNSKNHDDSENVRSGTGGCDDDNGGNDWGRRKGEGSAKGQAKGKKRTIGKVSEAQPAAESHVSMKSKPAGAQPRVRDEIQEEVDAIVSKNSNLMKADFDGRVFQYLHAIHGVGGQERVRKALETIHFSTLQKQRASVKKWPAYLATLLRKFFEDLGAEKNRAKVEAENYGKHLTLSVDALFDQPAQVAVPGGPNEKTPQASGSAANPQEADRSSSPEWMGQGISEERDQKWLERGTDLLLSVLTEPQAPGLPASPLAIRSIPPGFTPPQSLSPAHQNLMSPLALAHGLGNSFTNSPCSPHHPGMFPHPLQAPPPPPLPQAPVRMTPPQVPSQLPPPPPPPQLPSQPPPPPPTAFHMQDPYQQQRPALTPPPPPSQPPKLTPQRKGPPQVVSPPAPRKTGHQQQPHQPRVVPPPCRKQQPANAGPSPNGPPLPPTAPPMEPGDQVLPEDSWTTKSTPMLPPPWPAQWIPAA